MSVDAFECRACGETFEVPVSPTVATESNPRCPYCGSTETQKYIVVISSNTPFTLFSPTPDEDSFSTCRGYT
jgi:putative FmdB family regulatory protein